MRWLITGGCGFIGTSLAQFLIKTQTDDTQILAFDNLKVGNLHDLGSVSAFENVTNRSSNFWPSKLNFFEGDITNFQTICNLTANCDVIVHLAANTGVAPSVVNPFMDAKVNVFGTLNLLEASKINSVKKFIFASSGAPLGEKVPPLHEELAPKPNSPYGASKLAGEGYCSAYYGSFEVDTVILRFSNVYGPRSHHKDSIVARFIKSALSGESFQIYGDGLQTRDYLYIDDLLRAVIKASKAENIGGQTFQIATEQETSVVTLCELIGRLLKRRGFDLPPQIKTHRRVGDVMKNFSQTSKAKDLLHWTAKTPLLEGLEKTIQYFLDRKDYD